MVFVWDQNNTIFFVRYLLVYTHVLQISYAGMDAEWPTPILDAFCVPSKSMFCYAFINTG